MHYTNDGKYIFKGIADRIKNDIDRQQPVEYTSFKKDHITNQVIDKTQEYN